MICPERYRESQRAANRKYSDVTRKRLAELATCITSPSEALAFFDQLINSGIQYEPDSVSKKNTSRPSYTVSEDHTNLDAVRKKRLCALERGYPTGLLTPGSRPERGVDKRRRLAAIARRGAMTQYPYSQESRSQTNSTSVESADIEEDEYPPFNSEPDFQSLQRRESLPISLPTTMDIVDRRRGNSDSRTIPEKHDSHSTQQEIQQDQSFDGVPESKIRTMLLASLAKPGRDLPPPRGAEWKKVHVDTPHLSGARATPGIVGESEPKADASLWEPSVGVLNRTKASLMASPRQSRSLGDQKGTSPKMLRGVSAPPRRCHSCNRTDTPTWRPGPNGQRELCNACGLYYAKVTKGLETEKVDERMRK